MYTLLLADDSEPLRKALRRILETDLRLLLVGEADTFRNTLKIASKVKPHILLLDLHMPDDHEFQASFIKRELVWSCGKIFAMSAWRAPENEGLAEGYGATSLLEKADVANAVFEFVDSLESVRPTAAPLPSASFKQRFPAA